MTADEIDSAPIGTLLEITPNPNKPEERVCYLRVSKGWAAGYIAYTTHAELRSGTILPSMAKYAGRAAVVRVVEAVIEP